MQRGSYFQHDLHNLELSRSFFYPLTARRLRPLRWEMNCVCYL
ncbi:hypothetical protein EUBHAL_01262, partial [Anaerobutyricum hallii DSM 3353]